LSALEIVLRVLGAALAFGLMVWLGVALTRGAKRGGKCMQSIGAAVMLFGWGTMRDPANNPVAEAKDGRIRKGNTTGDPLEP
jgi:hypothetical protein